MKAQELEKEAMDHYQRALSLWCEADKLRRKRLPHHPRQGLLTISALVEEPSQLRGFQE